MKVRKISCFIICIGCLLCICLRNGYIPLLAKSNSIGVEHNKLVVDKVYNNPYRNQKSFSILIPVQKNDTKKVIIHKDWMSQYYELEFNCNDELSLEKDTIKRQFGVDVLKDIKIQKSGQENHKIKVRLKLNSIYEVSYSWYEEGIRIEFIPPYERYDKIIVLDAGHGGKDSGALSQNHKYQEKDITLSIVNKIGKYLEQKKIKVYYTRQTDDKIPLDQRVTFANMLGADLFLSIHCNSDKKAYPNGSAAFYAEQTDYNVADSKKIAENLLKATERALKLKNIGVYSGQKYHIVGNAKVPMVLLETGFISNNHHLKYLKDKESQERLAKEVGKTIIETIQREKE